MSEGNDPAGSGRNRNRPRGGKARDGRGPGSGGGRGGGRDGGREGGGRGPRGGRDSGRDGGRGAMGGGRQGGASGGDGRGGDGRGGARGPQAADVELLIISSSGSAKAPVFAGPVPPIWQRIPDVQLFGEGFYLKAGVKLQPLDKILKCKEAVVVALWEDPAQTFRVNGEEVRPGITATVLVPTPLKEGPPWIPMQAQVASSPEEFATGILNPWLDQVATIAFEPDFSTAKGRLTVATKGGCEASSSHGALRETLTWLANNPTDDSAGARLARRLLVENGHGLQRFGLSLMYASDEIRRDAVESILPKLAPVWASILTPLWDFWNDTDEAGRAARFLGLAHLLAEPTSLSGDLQKHDVLAGVVTWLSGLFGARPERSGLQPATSLFVLLRALRQANRQADALAHPDMNLPSFPLAGAERRRVLLELSRLPENETDIERMVRALAIAEMGHEIGRPRRDHLRPFRIVLPWVRAYPVASRTVGGRYDYIVSGWSFRGGELRDPGLPDQALRGVFVTDTLSMASARAYARAVASNTNAGRLLAAELREAVHPGLRMIGEFEDRDAVVARYQEAVTHDNITIRRLYSGIASAEWLLTRMECGDTFDELTFEPPVVPSVGGVRAHFMYWRMYCRSVAWSRSEIYGDMLEETLPTLGELPLKIQTEALALLRRWAGQNAAHGERAAAWIPHLDEAQRRYFESGGDERQRMSGEWMHQLSGSFAVLDRERYSALIMALVNDAESPMVEADRLLDGVRAAGWRRDFAASDAFRAMHRRLAVDDKGEHTTARAEWVRSALERAKHGQAVRWLLDGRAERALVDHPDFLAWFTNNALQDLRNPDDAVVRLLELALRVVGPARLDRVVDELTKTTSWTESQRLTALQEAGRPEAVLIWMLLSDAGDEATVNDALLAAIGHAESGRHFRHLAGALRRLEQQRHMVLQPSRDALLAKMRAYKPIRQALDGLADTADAIRLLDPSYKSVEPLVRAAGKWGLETNHPALVRLMAWALEKEAADVTAAGWASLLDSGSGDALTAAFASVAAPQSLQKLVEQAERQATKDPTRKRARNALLGLTLSGHYETALGDALTARLIDGTTPAELLERIEGWSTAKPTGKRKRRRKGEGAATASAESVEASVAALEVSTPSPDSSEPALPEAAAPVDATVAAVVSPEAAAEGAPEAAVGVTSEMDAADENNASPESSSSDSADLDRAYSRLRSSAEAVARELLSQWTDVFVKLRDSELPAPSALVRQAGRRLPVSWTVRVDMLGTLRRLCTLTGGVLRDPKRLLESDRLDDEASEVDIASWRVVLETLAAIQGLHSLEPTWTLRDGSVAMLIRGASELESPEEIDASEALTTVGQSRDTTVGQSSEATFGEALTTVGQSSDTTVGQSSEATFGEALTTVGQSRDTTVGQSSEATFGEALTTVGQSRDTTVGRSRDATVGRSSNAEQTAKPSRENPAALDVSAQPEAAVVLTPEDAEATESGSDDSILSQDSQAVAVETAGSADASSDEGDADDEHVEDSADADHLDEGSPKDRPAKKTKGANKAKAKGSANQRWQEGFKRAMAADATPEEIVPVFAHPAVPALLRLILNAERRIELGARSIDGHAAVQLSWKMRR